MGDKRLDVGAQLLDSVRSRRGLVGASAVAGAAIAVADGIERAAAGGFRDKRRQRKIRAMTKYLKAMSEDVRQLEDLASQLDKVEAFIRLAPRSAQSPDRSRASDYPPTAADCRDNK